MSKLVSVFTVNKELSSQKIIAAERKMSKLVLDEASTAAKRLEGTSRQDGVRRIAARKTGGSKKWLINSQIVLTMLSCLLGGTLIYGWAAYEPLLKADDFYSSLCSNSTDGRAALNECPPQQTALTLVFTVAAVAFTTTLLPCGVLADRLGPSTSGLISGLCLACGISSPIIKEDALLLPGFVLIGAGIAFSYATALKSVFLVRSTQRTFMLAAINSLFDSSALVPLVMNVLQRVGLATTGSLFAAHSVLVAVIFSLLSVGWMALLGGCRSDIADAREIGESQGESLKDPRWSLSLREILRERDYRWLACFTAIHIFRLNLYFGSVTQTLESLGDDDNFYALVFAASQPPLQILLSWPVSMIVVRLGHRRALVLIVACCAVHGGLALVPALLLQPVTFLSVAIYRVLFCTPHTGLEPRTNSNRPTHTRVRTLPWTDLVVPDLLAQTWGPHHSSTLVGMLFLFGGILCTAIYPLATLTNTAFGGDWTAANAATLGIALGGSLCALRVLHRDV